MGGHSDVTGGVVTGRRRPDQPGAAGAGGHGRLARPGRGVPAPPGPGDAAGPGPAAVLDGDDVRRHRVPASLRCARSTTRACREHPGHAVARRLFDAGPEGVRFGAIVTVTPHGGRATGMAFADRLQIAQIATSLGGTHTKSATRRRLRTASWIPVRCIVRASTRARYGSPLDSRTPRTSSPTPTWRWAPWAGPDG